MREEEGDEEVMREEEEEGRKQKGEKWKSSPTEVRGVEGEAERRGESKKGGAVQLIIVRLRVVLGKIHVAIFPLFSSDLRATMTESFVPGTNLNEENPRYLLRG